MPPEKPKPTLLSSMLTESGSPDVRSKSCLEAIQRALEEFDCQLQVNIQYPGNGGAFPNVIVVANGAVR